MGALRRKRRCVTQHDFRDGQRLAISVNCRAGWFFRRSASERISAKRMRTPTSAYTDAIVAAVEGGFNVIDSAINYRLQRSERP